MSLKMLAPQLCGKDFVRIVILAVINKLVRVDYRGILRAKKSEIALNTAVNYRNVRQNVKALKHVFAPLVVSFGLG